MYYIYVIHIYMYNMKLKVLAPWKENVGKSRQCMKKQRYHFANKSLHSQSCGFSSSHVQM